MDTLGIEGVIVTPLKIVPNPKGNILHALKRSDPGYKAFGEAYFSTVHYGEIKGWKKHSRMLLNVLVPVGEIKFVLYDDRPGSVTKGNYREERLSLSNYNRLTIPPAIWMGFQGLGAGLNLLLNIADIEHDPRESESADLNSIRYDWNNG
jgi:dTDP-4-dehydrorhamnose 3,5-epimerase